jgi:ABC-type antimicrobial peptide transport system permease subunit
LIDASGARIEIVGVVQSAPLSAAQRAAPPTLTRPIAQVVNRRMTMAVQVDGVNPERRAAIAEALLSVPGGAALGDFSTFEEHLERWALAPERIAALLITVLAGIALAVSISGIHGTMTDLVVRRRPELALRIALGARAPAVVAEVVRAAMRLAVIGIAVGGGGAMVATLFLGTTGKAVLPGPVVLLGAAGAVLLLVASSCAVPAWRAVSVDPREVIR